MKLDAQDRKLLYALDKNARESYVQLAKKCNLSKDAVKYRINNYLKSGVLGGFYTLINSSKLGYYSNRIYFSFRNTTPDEEKDILLFLKSEKNVFYLFEAEGYFDVGVGYFSKSLNEYKLFISEFKEKFEKVIIQDEGLFISLSHFERNYLIKKNRTQIPKKIIQEPKIEKVDKIDLKILQLISNNARIQIIELSEKLNLTSKAIIYRIKKLEKKEIILGYKTKINLDLINHSMYKIDLTIYNKRVIGKIYSFIAQLKNIIHTEEVHGGSDLEFDIECEKYDEFKEIINIIKNHYGTNIENIRHYRTTKIYKTIYFLEE
jgi:Lrp/AsnC family transcriptional regulator, leucine-responsive regulatory protein